MPAARDRLLSKERLSGKERPSDMLGRFWTAANVLSLMRLAIVVPVTWLIWSGGSLEWLFGLIVFGALTDFLDGRVARWSRTVSGWGKVLDPLADKFAAVMVISALTFRGMDPTLPLWFFVLVVARDLCIFAGGIVIAWRTEQVAQSGALGKTAVASLVITCLATILQADPPVLDFCVWLSAALLVGSFFIYLGRYVWVERTGGLPRRAQEESQPLRQDEEPEPPEDPPSSNGAASPDPPAVSGESRSEKRTANGNGVPHPS